MPARTIASYNSYLLYRDVRVPMRRRTRSVHATRAHVACAAAAHAVRVLVRVPMQTPGDILFCMVLRTILRVSMQELMLCALACSTRSCCCAW